MIYLFTDFSVSGPYVGELKSVLLRQQIGKEIIDLMHDAPAFNPKASAYLLAALSKQFKQGDACLGIVDPEVGNKNRRPIIVITDGVTYCGPDNGLFSQVVRRSNKADIYEISWQPQELSNSFHGRDLFAPALAKFMNNGEFKESFLHIDNIVGSDWPDNLFNVIYADHYGNCITGISADNIQPENMIRFQNHNLGFARTFSDKVKGQGFWYINSMGLVEISVNQGNASELFNLQVGSELTVD